MTKEEGNQFPHKPGAFKNNVENLIVRSHIQIYLDSFLDRKKIFYGLRILIKGFLRTCLESKSSEEIESLVKDLDNLKTVLKKEVAASNTDLNTFKLKDSLQISDSLMVHFYNSAHEVFRKGHYEEASAAFLVLASLDPFNESAWLSLGVIEQKLDKFKGAIEAYQVAQKVNPCNPASSIYQAQCQVKLENIPAAESHLSHAMQSLWWNNNPEPYRQHIHRLHNHIKAI
jgi:tetratricopeptide (TPR) repeat protein